MNTEILRLDASYSAEQLEALLTPAAEVLKRGGLVVFPTETVYGLGADATNAEAAKKIYEAKGRPSDNPLIIHVCSPSDAEPYAFTSELYYKLAERFMPGPLTVVMPAKDSVPMATRGGLLTVAVRSPENIVASKLISLVGRPVAAPSANLSGSPSPTSAEHVIADMMGRVDMIIDGGECDFGLESTIVKTEADGSLTLLRPGRITPDELALVADVNISPAVLRELGEGENAESPGMKYKHYAPSSEFLLLDADREKALKYVKDKEKTGQKSALFAYSEDVEYFSTALLHTRIYDIGERADTLTQAHRLFALLRLADGEGAEIIYAPLPEKDGISLALYNRMIRAAAHKIIKL